MSCDIDGYNEFESVTRPRARKQHECCACELPIRTGDVYERIAFKWEGEFECLTRCLRCCAIAKHLHTLMDGGEGVAYALDCGHEYEERWEVPPPPEIARLAFMLPDEIQREFGQVKSAAGGEGGK